MYREIVALYTTRRRNSAIGYIGLPIYVPSEQFDTHIQVTQCTVTETFRVSEI